MSEPMNNAATQPSVEQLSVGFVLMPRFTLLPFAAFVDCLRLAADEGDGSRPIRCGWTFMTSNGTSATSSCSATIGPCEPLSEPTRFDYLVVVGGLLSEAPAADAKTVEYLQRAAAQGVPLVGLCTGPFALIQAGLMHGRRCCVSWYHYRDLTNRLADIIPVADQLFVVDGNRITCAGGTAAADLAGWLVERHMGRAWAQKSLHIMLIDRARRGNTSQPQPPLYEEIGDNRVRRAVLLIEQHLGDPLNTEKIARRLSVSRRQLERAFRRELGMSPHQFSRNFRLRYGLWLLQNTERSITDISSECGFADTSHFSRQFHGQFGIPPTTARDGASRSRNLWGKIDPRDPADDVFECESRGATPPQKP
ncbi:GlxA family transcriptional regulator [Arhodomonas aquaeolei]|uniref:GlxA family transcriptional regulator n=1 Tax=Arhodomonas aquaeolei TaxID=2369 RepID=UPI002168D878|nr:GlxA family transcriptional regulator [Arhodomonas aquaeolei]MCS4503788.1 GlxA family transcriptional regulator [Arhodomonas aquaeolei]